MLKVDSRVRRVKAKWVKDDCHGVKEGGAVSKLVQLCNLVGGCYTVRILVVGTRRLKTGGLELILIG